MNNKYEKYRLHFVCSTNSRIYVFILAINRNMRAFRSTYRDGVEEKKRNMSTTRR